MDIHKMKYNGGSVNMFNNVPKIKLGIVAVSRDCFPESPHTF